MKNKSEYDTIIKEDFLKQINDSKALELQIQKDRKLSTFAKKNFQKGHRQPTMAMKEKAWKKSGGNCHSSLNPISSGDISNFMR